MGGGGWKMLEEKDLRTFRAIFLYLITATICLISTERAVFAAEIVDQSNLPEWAGGWTHINPDPNGQARMWQTFTPNYSNITAVDINILTVNPGDFNDIITVEIAKEGEVLASTELKVEYGFEGLLRFEFDETVPVIPGELYELKVHDTGLTRFGWKYASNTYDAGSRYVSASERPGTDWFFQTYSMEPRIIYVDDDAAGANDGSSWEDAYVYLQDALVDANSTEKPVEIRVAQGIYKPDQGANQTLGDLEATFQLINGVTLKGGFAGLGEPITNDRNVDVYETILSGDLNNNDRKVVDPYDLSWWESNRVENSYHVVTGSSTDETAVMDGFNIMSGAANNIHTIWSAVSPSNDEKNWSGGGMYNVLGSPTIINCTFTLNWAASKGGGIYNSGGNPTLIRCTFFENSADWYGGGMYNLDSIPILTSCTFSGNFARQGYSAAGGGIYNRESSPILTNCKFIGNWSFINGGGVCNQESNPTLTNCIFVRNSAQNDGGGIYNWQSSLSATNCTFTQNLAQNGSILSYESSKRWPLPNSLKLINCILWDGGNEIWNNDALPIDITYSDIQGGWPGIGNIDADPLFASIGYWADVNDPNAIWIDGDYHLKSLAGRWDPVSESWIIDDVTSPCIDAGDTNSPVGDEPEPNGGRINMGAYGGTAEASKSFISGSLQATKKLIRFYGFKYGK
jgi:hypothetical protein